MPRKLVIAFVALSFTALAGLQCTADLADGDPCYAIQASYCNFLSRCNGFPLVNCGQLNGGQGYQNLSDCLANHNFAAPLDPGSPAAPGCEIDSGGVGNGAASCASDIDALACAGATVPESCSSLPLNINGSGSGETFGDAGEGSTPTLGEDDTYFDLACGLSLGAGGNTGPVDAGHSSSNACSELASCCESGALPEDERDSCDDTSAEGNSSACSNTLTALEDDGYCSAP
jgi:hypothetical protein